MVVPTRIFIHFHLDKDQQPKQQHSLQQFSFINAISIRLTPLRG
jgi:hypothetical protein